MPPSTKARDKARKDTEALLAAAAAGSVAQLSGDAGAATVAERLTAAGADSAKTASLILALLAALAAARGGVAWIESIMAVEFADELKGGTVTDDELAQAAETEREREAAFIQGMEKRLRRDIPEALKRPDPAPAVQAVIDREQRYMDQHDDAAAARVQALIKRRLVKSLSPDGAFWVMNPRVKEHTPDCEALAAVGWWPWEVLDRINPPVHTGCRCDLLTRDEAIGMGYMGTELPDTSDAMQKAQAIIELFDLAEAEWRLEPPLDERDLVELYWNRRYPKGTIWGGRFMPKRGGFAPRISLREILRRIMGADAPNVVGRGGQRTVSAPDPEDVMRTPSSPGKGTGKAQPTLKESPNLEQAAASTGAMLEQKVLENGQQIAPITVEPSKTEERGGRRFAGAGGGSRVVIGTDHVEVLNRLSQKQASGQNLTPEEAVELYEARRVLTHELVHGSSAISFADYDTEEGFAIEEAVTEELTHALLVAQLVEEGNLDILREMDRDPDNPIWAGTYRIQRSRLRQVLDLAQVPEEDRQELLERLSFGTPTTEGRIRELGRLMAEANGISQQKGEDVVRGAMFLGGAAAGENRDQLIGFLIDGPAGVLTPRPILPDDALPADGFEVGDLVVVVGRGENDRSRDFARYNGRVVHRGFGPDGEPEIGVEVVITDAEGKKVGTEVRFPNAPDVQKIGDMKRKRLKGPNVTGPVQVGDRVRILRHNGDLEVVKLDQIVAFNKNGYTIDVKTEMGQRVRIRSTQIKDLQRAKDRTRSRKAPRPPKQKVPGGAKRVKAQMVSGPRGYDPRRYSDPRRSLLAKVTALDPGDELLLADGSTVERGVKGLATIERPDGSRKVYASPARLANAETEGVSRRIGHRSTMNTPSDGDPRQKGTLAFRNNQDAALDKGFMATPSYQPGEDHELLVGAGLMSWQENPDNATGEQLAAITHEVATGPMMAGPFFRGQPTDVAAPNESGRARGWSPKLDQAVGFALEGPSVVDEDGRRRRATGVVATIGELAPGEKLVATLYVAESGGGVDIDKRLTQAEAARESQLRKRQRAAVAEKLPQVRRDYVDELLDEVNERQTLEAARDALGLRRLEDETTQGMRLRIKRELTTATEGQIEDAVMAMDSVDDETRMGRLNDHLEGQAEEIAYEVDMEYDSADPFVNEYKNEAEVILDNDRLEGMRRVDVLVAEGGDPDIAKLSMTEIEAKVEEAIRTGNTFQLPEPPPEGDPPQSLPELEDFDDAIAMGASDEDFQMDDFTKGLMAKHGLMPGTDDSRELTPNEERMRSMAAPSMLEKLADGEGPVEDLLRRALDAVGVDPYDIDFEELDRHATGHEMLPESRLNIGGRGVSPCATFRSVDFAVHVLLPEMLAEKYPELATKLRSTSPRWGWRTGRLKPGISRPSRSPEPSMATSSEGPPLDRVLRMWSANPDYVREDYKAMGTLRSALQDAEVKEGPFFRGQVPSDTDPAQDIRGWSTNPGMAAAFALDHGVVVKKADGTIRWPTVQALSQSNIDDLQDGEVLVATVYRADRGRGLELEGGRPNEAETILDGGSVEGSEAFQIEIAKPGDTLTTSQVGWVKLDEPIARIMKELGVSEWEVPSDSDRSQMIGEENTDPRTSMATPSNLESRDAALDAAMNTPSYEEGTVGEAPDPDTLVRAVQQWTESPDAVRENPELLSTLRLAVENGGVLEGPFYRGQGPHHREPSETMRGWSKDPEIAARFALNFGVARRRPDGTVEPFRGSGSLGAVQQVDIDQLAEGEELLVKVFRADGGRGIDLNTIMLDAVGDEDWGWGHEEESILNGPELTGYDGEEVVIARAGEQLEGPEPMRGPFGQDLGILPILLDRIQAVIIPRDPGGMATPSFNLFNWTKQNRPEETERVERSLLERPPTPVQGIPSYEAVKLTDVEAAGGSNGARIAVDENGNSWLLKPYRGDADRVATELLSNAVYRELGVRVPNAGVGISSHPQFGDQIAVSYPLIEGEIRQWDTPDPELGDGFVADALLANWDVIGLTQDNVLWNNGQPIRLDQGGTLEFRAQGAPKDYGPIPAELWTMRSQNGQANGTMEITEAGMRAAARDAALRLPPQRIDQLVDEAPFADEGMRERVRQSLKDRVAWLERFADGKEGLPEPLEGDDAIDYLDDRDDLLITEPEEDAALSDFMGDMGGVVERHLQSGAPKDAASPEVQQIVYQLDGLLGIEETQIDEDLIAFATLPALENPDALKGRTVTEKSFLPLKLRSTPEAETTLRVQIPAGVNVVSPSALGVDAEPEAILLPRNSRLQITKVTTADGRTQLEGQIVSTAPPPAPKPVETMSRMQLLKALGLEDSNLTDAELRDRLRLKRGAA